MCRVPAYAVCVCEPVTWQWSRESHFPSGQRKKKEGLSGEEKGLSVSAFFAIPLFCLVMGIGAS